MFMIFWRLADREIRYCDFLKGTLSGSFHKNVGEREEDLRKEEVDFASYSSHGASLPAELTSVDMHKDIN